MEDVWFHLSQKSGFAIKPKVREIDNSHKTYSHELSNQSVAETIQHHQMLQAQFLLWIKEEQTQAELTAEE